MHAQHAVQGVAKRGFTLKHQRGAVQCFHRNRHSVAGQPQWGGRYGDGIQGWRSEEHTSELQSLMRISYAVFCLKKKRIKTQQEHTYQRLHPMNTYVSNKLPMTRKSQHCKNKTL